MTYTPERVIRTYVGLMLFNTLAASFIWGINTIFLLSAGLSNFEAFAANAFFTAGMMLFEVPTGIVADSKGRQISYILGCVTLILSTLLYVLLWYITAPFWMWAVVSLLLGLGFTFFSGALEAWLVDALHFTGFKGALENVYARGQIATGIAMLTGSVLGGVIAQATNLGVPYFIRAALLVITLGIAHFFMKDLGFKPEPTKNPIESTRALLKSSIENGYKKPAVRWLMLAGLCTGGVGFYVFYSLQPYLLELYGNSNAYGIAGLAAAIVAGAQIAGGLAAPKLRTLFKRRTTYLITATIVTALILILTGLIVNFWVVLVLMTLWGLMFAAVQPIRQTYLNSLIESKHRATVLSFDSLMSSSGAVVSQPILGKTADVYGYAPSYLVSAAFELLSLPFLLKAKKENVPTDTIENGKT